MTDRPATNTTMRRLAGGSLAVLALAAACGAELPTSAELQGMDVAAAQKRAFVAAPNLTAASYMVDGKAVSEQEAKSIAANRIASIEIRKQDKKSSVVRITTQAAKTAAKSEAVRTTGTVAELRIDTRADSTRSLLLEGKRPLADTTSLTSAVILIDDVRVTADAMKKIDPSQIESVQILKGAAAEALYGADGAKGVIRITTKKK